MDIVSPEARSRNMGRISGKDTAPELVVRQILRSLGVGYRLHVAGLPGRPDIVMSGRRAVIEVRGCFWHRHPGCRLAYQPKTRPAFWQAKFAATVARDGRNATALDNSGWRLLVVWECETSDANLLEQRIAKFLDTKAAGVEEEGRSDSGQAGSHRTG